MTTGEALPARPPAACRGACGPSWRPSSAPPCARSSSCPSAAWRPGSAEWIGSIAWSLASFFVVPVLAVEDVGVRAALRRSVGTIRSQWGESVTGVAVIGTVVRHGDLHALRPRRHRRRRRPGGFEPGYALTALAAVAFVATVFVQAAVGQVFRLAVFRHASGQGATGPFAAADLDAAFRPRRGRRS